MEFRKDNLIAPDLGIQQPLQNFTRFKVPKGKDVLERFYAFLWAQLKNRRDMVSAANQTASELVEIWLDACVPLCTMKTIKKNILDLQIMLNKLKWTPESRPSYQITVSGGK